MATFELSLSDGSAYEIDADDEGAATAKLQAFLAQSNVEPTAPTAEGFAPRSAREAPGNTEGVAKEVDIAKRMARERPMYGAADKIAGEMTLGLKDEAQALGSAVGGLVRGQNPIETYQNQKEAINRLGAEFNAAHPVAGPALEFGGAMLSVSPARGVAAGAQAAAAASASRLERAKEFGKQGAIVGGIGGYGHGDGALDSATGAALGAGIGAGIGGGIGFALPAAAPTVAKAASPLVEAAERQNIPIARGIASESPKVQALAQASRAAPIGGDAMENAATNFVGGIRKRAEELAVQEAGRPAGAAAPTAQEVGDVLRQAANEEIATNDALTTQARRAFEALAPEAPVTTKAVLGDELRGGFERTIARNREAQTQGYTALRNVINPDRPVQVTGQISGLNQIMRERAAAAQGELPRELMPALELATNPQGATFSGLQRARSTLAERIQFEEAQGFNAGDLRRGYGFLTGAMRHAVASSARRGQRQPAIAAFEAAEENFGRLAEMNTELGGAVRSGGEALVDRLIGYASDRSRGNIERLNALRTGIPHETFSRLSRTAFDRLATDATGEFSEAALVKNWAALSPEGRNALFTPGTAPRIEAAIRGLQSASNQTRQLNAEVLKIVSASDEKTARSMLNLASTGSSADIIKLQRLTNLFGDRSRQNLASLAIQEMGNARNGEFTAAAFASNWRKMSDQGKTLLFPQTRAHLDDLARLSEKAVDVERRYLNRSNTARSTMTGLGMAGMVVTPMSTMATALGQTVLAKVMARPVTAQASVRWARAYDMAVRNPTRGALTTINQVTRQYAATLAKEMGVPANDVAAKLMSGLRSGRAGEQDKADNGEEQNDADQSSLLSKGSAAINALQRKMRGPEPPSRPIAMGIRG